MVKFDFTGIPIGNEQLKGLLNFDGKELVSQA